MSSPSKYDDMELSKAWRAFIGFVQLWVPYGNIALETSVGEPSKLIRAHRDIDFRKEESLVLFDAGNIVQLGDMAAFNESLDNMRKKQR